MEEESDMADILAAPQQAKTGTKTEAKADERNLRLWLHLVQQPSQMPAGWLGSRLVQSLVRGLPEHPAWFFNARANPEVKLNGRPYRAEVVSDEAERARLWALADNVFPPFESYRREAGAAGRTIPILQLKAP